MQIIELDLTDCKTLRELHERIKVAFDFPEWYGKNWDAFRDLIRTDCDAHKVIVKGENTLREKYNEDLNMMHKVFESKIEFNKKCNFGDFIYEVIS